MIQNSSFSTFLFSLLKILLVIGICCLNEKNNVASYNIPDDEYVKMPELFEMDDFDHCMMRGDSMFYCEITFILQPEDPNNKSEIWNIIEKVSADPKNYRHDWLRHGICVPKTCPEISQELYEAGEGSEELRKQLSECYSKKYVEMGLKGEISRMHCETKEPFYKITSVDVAVALIFGFFLLFLIFATFYEGMARYKTKEEYEEQMSSTGGQILACFSLIRNFERLTSKNTNPDANKLKSIQGIRFYNMICVIMAHVVMGLFHGPVSNPTFTERTTDEKLNMFVANGGYVVQTFFAISGFLTTFHFFEMSEGKKHVKFYYVILAFLNRYVRLIPALLVTYVFSATWLYHVGRGPYWDRLVGTEYRNCRYNGWSNLLFINNYYNNQDMCLQHTWYMAVDSQVFIVAIILVWLMKNNRKHAVTISLMGIFVATIVPMMVNYYHDYDILVRQYAEPLYDLLLKVPQWHIMFASGYNNMAGYLTGVLFGYIFYVNKEKECFTSKVYTVLWWITVWALPLFVILIAGIMYNDDFEYTRFGAAFYVGISRTLFPLGIIFAIWGFSQKQGWFMRFFTEWDSVQVFGRLTYCAYLVHVALLKMRIGRIRRPSYISVYLMVFDTLGDVTFAYLIATLLCIGVEMPVSALQKLMIPQRKRLVEDKEHTKESKEEREKAIAIAKKEKEANESKSNLMHDNNDKKLIRQNGDSKK